MAERAQGQLPRAPRGGDALPGAPAQRRLRRVRGLLASGTGNLMEYLHTLSDILARCRSARHTKIGSVLFLSYDKFMPYGTKSLIHMCHTV
jgi:hypothetical protein